MGSDFIVVVTVQTFANWALIEANTFPLFFYQLPAKYTALSS
ncbi:hypothetical protein N44_01770 [Microcystis aeruginosa NIES-44]|jgi:hypothetical protein|uniref:Uncharacterized protein n=1 Tax=Microcystis aeruginosa NIES-44 TaxID=449439 RepID=A0A0A1VUC7_MICAE|nr:hypothetical protein N44_01770 [Microcystis aeruginosa NIES-44]